MLVEGYLWELNNSDNPKMSYCIICTIVHFNTMVKMVSATKCCPAREKGEIARENDLRSVPKKMRLQESVRRQHHIVAIETRCVNVIVATTRGAIMLASTNSNSNNNSHGYSNINIIIKPPPRDVSGLEQGQRPRRTPLYIIVFGCAYMAMIVLLVPNPRDLFSGGGGSRRDLSLSTSNASGGGDASFRLQFVDAMFQQQSTNNTNTGSTNNDSTTSIKPTMILHMGPPKTSTTYLQCILTNMVDTLALDNYVFLGIQEEACQPKQNKKKTWYRRYYHRHPAPPRLLGHESCYDLFAQKRTAEFSPTFLYDLRNAHSQGKHVIIMNECLKFLTFDQRRLVIDEFSSNWNVKLVMNYRRIFEFLPSSYNQGHKPKIENPSSALWLGQTNETNTTAGGVSVVVTGTPLQPFDIEDRGYHTRVFQDMETKGLHPVSTLLARQAAACHYLNIEIRPKSSTSHNMMYYISSYFP
jgi:hypothetical protein